MSIFHFIYVLTTPDENFVHISFRKLQVIYRMFFLQNSVSYLLKVPCEHWGPEFVYAEATPKIFSYLPRSQGSSFSHILLWFLCFFSWATFDFFVLMYEKLRYFHTCILRYICWLCSKHNFLMHIRKHWVKSWRLQKLLTIFSMSMRPRVVVWIFCSVREQGINLN